MLTVDKNENKYFVSFYNTTKLNILNSEEIKSTLLPLVKQAGSSVVLNFSGIKFIDSSGFQVLLDLYRASKINNSDIDMIHVSDELAELFQLVELGHVFHLN